MAKVRTEVKQEGRAGTAPGYVTAEAVEAAHSNR